MEKLTVYSTSYCPYCDRAKQLLDARGLDYEEIRVDLDPKKREEMISASKRRTVPQIFVGSRHIGGFQDLQALDQAGTLMDIFLTAT